MENLNELIKKYSVNHDRKIKKICEPLLICFGIPYFTYYSIRHDGKLNVISNYSEQLEFFYSEKLYKDHPYMCHPSLFRSGYAFTLSIKDPFFLEISKNRYHLDHLFIKLAHTDEGLEGFLFASNLLDSSGFNHYLSHLDSLEKFSKYFKREASALLKKSEDDHYNLLEAKGESFYISDPTLTLASQDLRVQKFRKLLSPLSKREQECLDFFQKGKSAQATAAILGLSKRTVEHYFESIKNKLGCYSKWDLLDW